MHGVQLELRVRVPGSVCDAEPQRGASLLAAILLRGPVLAPAQNRARLPLLLAALVLALLVLALALLLAAISLLPSAPHDAAHAGSAAEGSKRTGEPVRLLRIATPGRSLTAAGGGDSPLDSVAIAAGEMLRRPPPSVGSPPCPPLLPPVLPPPTAAPTPRGLLCGPACASWPPQRPWQTQTWSHQPPGATEMVESLGGCRAGQLERRPQRVRPSSIPSSCFLCGFKNPDSPPAEARACCGGGGGPFCVDAIAQPQRDRGKPCRGLLLLALARNLKDRLAKFLTGNTQNYMQETPKLVCGYSNRS
jgi:hypothetical protein